jgi:hypothetical protein
VDVVASGEERHPRQCCVLLPLLLLLRAIVHQRARGRHDLPEEEPSPSLV